MVKGYRDTAAFEISTSEKEVVGKEYSLPTLNIQMAGRANKHAEFDWSSKVNVQLSFDELFSFTALMYGLMPSCRFARPTKGIVITREQGGVKLHASAKGTLPVTVYLTLSEAAKAAELALSRCATHTQTKDPASVLNAIKANASLYI